MAIPATSALNYFVTNALNQTDWSKNFNQIVNWLSDGNANIQVSTVKAGGLPSYASNAAAITGGLAVGQFYRNGDNVCVVH